ncbi:MAG: major capsid protein [Microvirus sp.]|nr:MAG: major capsid protein [Microvirus sp.]
MKKYNNKSFKHSTGTQSQEHFASAIHADIQRSTFMRNSTLKTTFNCGDLVPIYCTEYLPGDTVEMDLKNISRLVTPIHPTMDNIVLDYYAFSIPNRLVWENWTALMGENKSSAWAPSVEPALVPRYSSSTLIPSLSIGDYMGLPVGVSTTMCGGVSVTSFRAYALVYNEWFRDQNLQAPIPISLTNTVNYNSAFAPQKPLFKVNKKHDYFTSCLPAPQKGQSQFIPISIDDYLPVISRTVETNPYPVVPSLQVRSVTSGVSFLGGNLGVSVGGHIQRENTTPVSSGVSDVYISNLWADGTGKTFSGGSVSSLRTAFQVQKLFEKDARGGTRYVEMLKSHFGVEAEDFRVQRPELLGHLSTGIDIYQIAQTSSTDNVSPQGNLSAFGHAEINAPLFKKSFVEHGILQIYAVARHKKTYQYGLEKMFSRRSRLDYYLPTLANISEQPVLNKEIFVSSNNVTNEEVFGYNEAWADYRYKPNYVTGQFRSTAVNSLDVWHYADKYTDIPILSDSWIQDNSKINVDRTLAVSSLLSNQIYADFSFINKSTRPMPVYSVPGLVDHF